MNYYSFHIGDYAAHTRHLTPMEDLAYRRLLDEYYLQECPLSGTIEEIARRIGLNECSTDVERVLNDYFEWTDFGWSNKRCDAEIERYQVKQAKQIAAGKASGEARKSKRDNRLNRRSTTVQRTFSECSTDVEPTNNQEPITKSISSTRKSAPRFDDFWTVYPRKEAKGAALKAWTKAIAKAEPDQIIDRVNRWKASKNFPERQFIPLPASWLNAERWSDELLEDQAVTTALVNQVFVIEGSREWDLWTKKRGKPAPVTDWRGQDGHIRRGWFFPSLEP